MINMKKVMRKEYNADLSEAQISENMAENIRHASLHVFH